MSNKKQHNQEKLNGQKESQIDKRDSLNKLTVKDKAISKEIDQMLIISSKFQRFKNILHQLDKRYFG